MRTPEGKPSRVAVERGTKGIALSLSRGDLSFTAKLPPFAARAIAEAIIKLLQEGEP